MSTDRTHANIWLHRWAVLTAVTVFPLVISGGTVTSMKVGMADPMWPTPPWYLLTISWLEQGLGFLIEHSHRQIGWIVGVMVVVLAAWLWRLESRSWLRWLGVIAVAAVSLQGVLGGLRVRLNEIAGLEFAIVHGVLAQLIFCLLAAIAMMTSRSWKAGDSFETEAGSRIRRLSASTLGLMIAQLVAGVVLRQQGVDVWLHMFLATAVFAHVLLLARRILPHRESWASYLSVPILVMFVLVAVQIALGFAAWLLGAGVGALDHRPVTTGRAIFATAHVATGGLLLVTTAILTLRVYRHVQPIAKIVSVPLVNVGGGAA